MASKRKAAQDASTAPASAEKKAKRVEVDTADAKAAKSEASEASEATHAAEAIDATDATEVKDADEPQKCGVCLGPFEDPVHIMTSRCCQKVFHFECYRGSVQEKAHRRRPHCPLCEQDVVLCETRRTFRKYDQCHAKCLSVVVCDDPRMVLWYDSKRATHGDLFRLLCHLRHGDMAPDQLVKMTHTGWEDRSLDLDAAVELGLRGDTLVFHLHGRCVHCHIGASRDWKTVDDWSGMNVHLKTTLGRTLTFKMWTSDTVECLQYLIQEREGLPAWQQRIIFNGKYLESHRSLSDYNIQRDAIITVALKLRGS